MAIWDNLLSDHDKQVLAARAQRASKLKGGISRGKEFGERPALLNIDMNIGAVGENRPIYEQLDRYPSACGPYAWAAIPYQQELMAGARTAGVPVILTLGTFQAIHQLPGYDDPDYSHSELSPQSEFQPEVAPQPGDLFVEKANHASVFFDTPLLRILLNKKIDTLLLMGNSTSGCVRATAVDGSYYPNMRIFLIEEATFDRFELSHKAALFDMNMKYATVVSASEVLDYFQRLITGRKVLAAELATSSS